MARAGYCSKCQKNVCLTSDGFCQFGHEPDSISKTYEIESASQIRSEESLPELKPYIFADSSKRVVAFLIDLVILFAITMGFGVVQEATANSNGEVSALGTTMGYVWLIVVVLYFAFFEASAWQGTPGKKTMKIAVTDYYGNRATFGRTLGRTFARFASQCFLCMGYWWAYIDKEHRTWHDMLAKTRVVKAK